MVKKSLAWGLLALVFSIGDQLIGADSEPPNIQVSGTATLSTAPDLMVWNLSVETANFDIEQAAKTHDKNVAILMAFFQEKGLSDIVKISNVKLNERQKYVDHQYVDDGYQATSSITFRTDNLKIYRELWLGLAALKFVQIDSVGFETSKRIRLQNESRKQSLLAAKQKAKDLAATLDQKIGKPLEIKEIDINKIFGGFTSNRVGGTNLEDASKISMSLDEIEISTKLSVKFQLLPQ